MADTCCQYAFAGIEINDETDGTDRLVIDEGGEVTGLDGAPIRSQVDPKGQADGGIVHTKRFGPRVVRFKGWCDIRTVENRLTPEYREALVALQAAVISALEGALNTESNLVWTPAGSTQHSLACTYGTENQAIQFSPIMIDCEFVFELLAADPTITVA